RQDRVDDQQRQARARAARRVRLTCRLCVALRAAGVDAPGALHARGLACHHRVARIGRDVEGPEAPRLELRRAHHRVCLHAGDGPRERPPRRLRRAGGGAAGTPGTQLDIGASLMMATAAPSGSTSTEKRPTFGMSCGAYTTWPPSDLAFSAIASQSA